MFEQIDQWVKAYEQGQVSRRTLLARLGGLVAAAGMVRGAVAAEPAASTFTAVGLNHIALNVTDVARSRAFYERHLGLKTLRDGGERSCFLGCGDEFVALFKDDKPAMDHYCYSVRGYEAGDAVERLKAAGLSPRRSDNRVYFDDPDGLEVQVAAPDHGV